MADLTVEILKQIRDGIATMNRDLNQRLEAVEQRVGQVESGLGARLDRVDLRLERVERGLNDLGEFMKQRWISPGTNASTTSTST